MVDRERGPEPGGDDRSGGTGDPSTARAESVPRQLPPGESAGAAATAVGESGVAITESPVRLAHRRDQKAADLRQKLDEKAAATDELREALDELRQVLDVDNPPPPSGAGRRRVRLIALLLSLLVVGALVLVLLLDRGSGGIVAGAPSGTPSSVGSPTATSGAGGAASGAEGSGQANGSVSPAPALRPMPWRGSTVLTPPGLTTSGPGASEAGTDLQVVADPDGVNLNVFERIVLEGATADPLTLAAPTLPSLAAARIEDLQIQLDDRPVAVSADGSTSWTVAPAPGDTYTRATLRYRVVNGIAAVDQSAPGRAFGIVTPLSGVISAQRGHPVQIRATDPTVRGVSCPTAPQGAVCGSRSAGGWTAIVPAGSEPLIVLLQVDTKR